MKKHKLLFFKIGFSVIAILLFISHLIWPKFINDNYSLILLLLVFIPWMNIIIKKFEFFGIGVDYQDQDDAKDLVRGSIKTVDKNELILPFQGNIPINKEKTSNNDLLFFKARINHPFEAGAQFLLKIIVNNELLNQRFDVNKPNERVIGDKRILQWFNIQKESWSIPYSPDFKSNYLNEKYKVENGDAYLFIFDLSKLNKINSKYNIVLYHTGTEEKEVFKNDIIIKGLEIA